MLITKSLGRHNDKTLLMGATIKSPHSNRAHYWGMVVECGSGVRNKVWQQSVVWSMVRECSDRVEQ